MFNNPADLPPAKNAEERKVIIQTASKQNSGYNNPCVKEQKLSYKCLSENDYDKEKCAVVFANYSACRDFWERVKSHRRANGIRPFLPWPEDRDKVKAEYIIKFNLGGKIKDNRPPGSIKNNANNVDGSKSNS